MTKKTTILIIALLLFTVGLIYIAIMTEQESPPPVEEEVVTEESIIDIVPTINPQTQIYFEPGTINALELPQQVYTVNVKANTNGQSITGIQLDIEYDPQVITNLSLVKASEDNLLSEGDELINNIDTTLGRATYAIALGINAEEEVSGEGNIATLTFSLLPSPTQTTTQISILPKSTVRSLQSTNSLLQQALPLNIVLPQQVQQQAPPETPLETPAE